MKPFCDLCRTSFAILRGRPRLNGRYRPGRSTSLARIAVLALAVSACDSSTEPEPEIQHWSATPVAASGGLIFSSISAGWDHTCGVTADGAGYCWGANERGELGIGTTSSDGRQIPAPAPIVGGLRFKAISAGRGRTCGLTVDGEVYCWGLIGSGTFSATSRPVQVSTDVTFAAVSVGGIHTCGLARTGRAYCWGSDVAGQLGRGM